MLSQRLLLCLGGFALAVATAAAADEIRFSRALGVEARQETGLERLSDDQVAILDALVRRESPPPSKDGTPGRFSQQLTEDERRNAGVAGLTPDEVQRLDAAVARHRASGSARSLLAPPVFVSHRSAARLTEADRSAEVHGSVTLSYGWGSDGYSTRSGSMVVNMTDPNRRYSVTIGYGESHITGPTGPALPRVLPPRALPDRRQGVRP